MREKADMGEGGEGLIVKGDDQVERCCDEN
jgi:hypothetical protein